MRIRLRRQAAAPILSLLTGLGGCASGSEPARRPEPPEERILWVDPGGHDASAGTREAPLRTLQAALSRDADVLRLFPGEHRGPELLVAAGVRIEGAPTATVTAHVFVGADDVTLRGLTLTGGLRVGLAEGVRLERLHVQPGERSEALGVHRAEVRLIDVALSGGHEAGLQVSASTVTASALRVRAAGSRRAVRLDGGRLELERSVVEGGALAALQAAGSSTASFSHGRIGRTAGSGVIALDGARVRISESRIFDVKKMGLLARRAELDVRTSTVTRCGEAALALAGAVARVSGGRLEAGRIAAVNLSRHRERPSAAKLEEVTVDHGAQVGLLVGGGTAAVTAARFVGGDAEDPTPGNQSPAVLLHGPAARIRLERVQILRPAGPGVSSTDDARLEAAGLEVREPLGDGLVVEDVLAAPTELREVSVADCRGAGAGLRVLGSSRVRVSGLDVEGCSDGALVAGAEASVALSDGRAAGGRYGAAAFGGSLLRVQSSTLTGEVWSLFASCSDGARIVDAGGNRLIGPTALCP